MAGRDRLGLVLFLLVVSAGGTLFWPGPTAAAQTTPEPQASPLDQLRRAIRESVDGSRVPGVGLALIENGRVTLAEGFGWADRAARRPVTADSYFRVASISKSTVALAALRLAERGEIDLTRPLAEYVPHLKQDNPWQSSDPVTLAHALEHSAGFDDVRFNERGSFDTPHELPVADALAINPNSRRSRWRPGDGYAYANPGTSVAARALEAATGREFSRLIEDEVFTPLQMQGASFRKTTQISQALAQGYRADGHTPVPYITNPHRAAGNLMASPRQLGRMVAMLVRRGLSPGPGPDEPRLWREASILRMERSETRPDALAAVAYGLGNFGEVSQPLPSRGHNGGKAGFVSDYRYFPQSQTGFVLLFNCNAPGRLHKKLRRLIFDYLHRNHKFKAPPSYTPAPGELEALVGSYEFQTPRHELWRIFDELAFARHVRLDTAGRAQLCNVDDSCVPLLATDRHQFRVPGASAAMVAFEPQRGRMLIGNASYRSVPSWLIKARAAGLRAAQRLIAIGPILFLAALLAALVHARDHELRVGLRPLVLPNLACLSYWALPRCFEAAAEAGVLGQLHPWTFGFYLNSLVCALLSGTALALSLRGLRNPERPLWAALLALGLATACFGLCIWLARGHVIGLRTWLW